MMQMRIILNSSVGTVKRLRISLGTFIAIEATGSSASAAVAAIEAAFAAITGVHRRMHPQAPDSDLARINNSPLDTPVTVHSSICDLLNLARRLHTLTDGVFDPCLPTRSGRLQDIEVSNDRVLCHAPVALDFGGFAKGHAVDRAIEVLRSHGCIDGLVNAGGDLRVFGPRTEPTFLRGPAGELTNVMLSDAALAVSDANSQSRPAEHRGYYVRARALGDDGDHANADLPVIDFAAVIAREAVIADALAKCVLLCRKATAERALREFGAALPAAR
jgi:FAD:protein FMN transferase